MVLIGFREPCTDVGSIYDTAPCHWWFCSINTVKKATNRFSHFLQDDDLQSTVYFFHTCKCSNISTLNSFFQLVYPICNPPPKKKKEKKIRQCTVKLSQSLSDDSLELEEEDDDDDDWGFLFFCLFLWCFPCFLFFLLFFLWLFSFFFFFPSSDEELDLLRFFFFFVGSSSLDDDADLMNDIIKWMKNHDPAE